ncbi:uncharacterized protein GGS25DRAFT_487507 [Hypoxylon fragiforme]|uniref:uncharacterized protein n=1 Tax=Hypoxylon fragiforme TaxID=63214 RepID=UPI0020C70035|nr:uncharacterized protein GGS25DRAFT_487507 [Hypoxylon fragiforme]KAI2610116.1 hypothetical protein GGS25DRAFT_487507 [Hypoxylon fragiforme]
MVGTRSGGRVHAQIYTEAEGQSYAEAEAQVQAQLMQEESSRKNVESSDDDVDEIPNSLPRNSTSSVSLPSLGRRRTRNQLDESRFIHLPQPKRRKIEHANAYPHLTSTSSSDTRPIRMRTSHTRSERSESEEIVPAGLLNSVNAVLKQDENKGHTTGHELESKIGLLDNGHADSPTTRENLNFQQAPQDKDEPNASIHNEESPQSRVEFEGDNDIRDHRTEGHSPIDPYDVPVTPPRYKNTGYTNGSKRVPPRASLAKAPRQGRYSNLAKSSQTDQPQVAEDVQSASEDDDPSSLVLEQAGSGVEVQQHRQDGSDAGQAAENIDESSADNASSAVIEQFAEEDFAQDVADFHAQHPHGYLGDVRFEGPSEDTDIVTTLKSSNFTAALRLMRVRAWAGRRSGQIYGQPFDVQLSGPKPVQALLQFLTKLNTLIKAAPKAPRFREQNLFLNEHSALIGYYFSKIKHAIKHIWETRNVEGGPNQPLTNDDIETQDELLFGEIVSFAIPMLFRVMASMWHLGGNNRPRAVFTTSTIEFLTRALGWIERLYRPLLRRLRQELSDGSEERAKDQKEEWRAHMKKREELGGFLDGLRQDLECGLDKLESEESRRIQEEQVRQQHLKRQEEVEAQQKQEEEAALHAIKEQNWRSLMSIRGIYTPLSESAAPSSTRQSSASQGPPQGRPPQTQPTLGIRRDTNPWSPAEKTYLFREIQQSYPRLPDLETMHWEIDRTIEETEAMAEEILGLMLEAVHPNDSAQDIDAQIQEIMHEYRRMRSHR